MSYFANCVRHHIKQTCLKKKKRLKRALSISIAIQRNSFTFSIHRVDLNRLPISNSQNCSLFPLAFVAGWLQGHWWGLFSRNCVVWPTFFLMNVFIALIGFHFWFLFELLDGMYWHPNMNWKIMLMTYDNLKAHWGGPPTSNTYTVKPNTRLCLKTNTAVHLHSMRGINVTLYRSSRAFTFLTFCIMHVCIYFQTGVWSSSIGVDGHLLRVGPCFNTLFPTVCHEWCVYLSSYLSSYLRNVKGTTHNGINYSNLRY